MASLFYEPSTRTRLSCEAAMMRLGGNVIGTENGNEFSSAAKGETLEDTIRVVGHYADVIVLRHAAEDAAVRAARVAQVPIINAGSGAGQHPTQALLDLYTIRRAHGHIDGLSITMAGDLKHGRTVRSLAYLLGKFQGINLQFISPPELMMGDDIKGYLHAQGVTFTEHRHLEAVMGTADVVYQTRIQKERFADPAAYNRLKGVYQITRALAQTMKSGAILMHPLPRVDEILPEVDDLPQAYYFLQAKYGMLVRMAVLKGVLSA
ncbi:MAG: hypothetical protein RL141_10 [Candidatus Parcubacteria bacterium]